MKNVSVREVRGKAIGSGLGDTDIKDVFNAFFRCHPRNANFPLSVTLERGEKKNRSEFQ